MRNKLSMNFKGFELLAIVLFALVTIGKANAQAVDSTARSVMIIPFDPNMYFSDADEQLKKYNQKSVKEIRTLFRYGLNINVNAKIMSLYYPTRPLLTDTAKGAVDDLYQIYKGISYFKDKSMPAPDAESRNFENGEKKKLFTLKTKKQETQAQNASALKEPDARHEYINVRIHDDKMLPYLKE